MEKKKTKKKLKYNAPSVLCIDSELHSYCADGSSANVSTAVQGQPTNIGCGSGSSADEIETCYSGSVPNGVCLAGGSVSKGQDTCVSGSGDTNQSVVGYNAGGSCNNGDAPHSSAPGTSGCDTGNGVT